GFPGHLALEEACRLWAASGVFQTRTGFPGHLASSSTAATEPVSRRFQTRTGFPGHLACPHSIHMDPPNGVSNPNGLPRPFSQNDSKIDGATNQCFKPE